MNKTASLPTAPSVASIIGAYLIATAIAAATIPAVLAYNVPPSATFFNQAAAVIGWGVVAALIGALIAVSAGTSSSSANANANAGAYTSTPSALRRYSSGLRALYAALGVMALAAAASTLLGSLPSSLSISAVGMIAIAAMLVHAGAAARRAGLANQVFRALCIALVVAGLVSVLIACIQVFFQSWADGTIIARAEPGRASGNLRQPNHLASLVMWSAIAAVWLAESRAIRRALGAALVVLFVFTVALSGSRTGVLEVVALAVWGACDRRLSGRTRLLLVAVPGVYVVSWLGLAEWAKAANTVYGGMQRLQQADVSSSRFAIWSNAIDMIKAQPWLGVGFGEFNLAWTLTSFAYRPWEFFDDPHNLILHLATELGIPLAALVTLMLCRALWGVFANSRRDDDPQLRQATRAAGMMIVTIGIHSQLEYPLWYAYFLLPTALMFGLGLGSTASRAAPAVAVAVSPAAAADQHRTRASVPWALMAASVLVVVAGIASLFDYNRVVVIFSPSADASPLMERIERGRRSVLFSHHADYAMATTEQDPPPDLRSFGGSVHYLLDDRLITAWADAYARSGDLQRASWLAGRLREFGHQDSKALFDRCAAHASGNSSTLSQASTSTSTSTSPSPLTSPSNGRVKKTLPDGVPYQCLKTTQPLSWRDFARP